MLYISRFQFLFLTISEKNIDFLPIKACRNINLHAIGHENLSLL